MMSKVRIRRGMYSKAVSDFYDSKEDVLAYPLPQGVNRGTYANGFSRAVSKNFKGKITVHCFKCSTDGAILLQREE